MNCKIRVDGKTYAKSVAWGNRERRVVFKNRKKYNRKKHKHLDEIQQQ